MRDFEVSVKTYDDLVLLFPVLALMSMLYPGCVIQFAFSCFPSSLSHHVNLVTTCVRAEIKVYIS